MAKRIIYQMLPRLWGEGKFSSIDTPTLNHIASLGVTHVWYTGLQRHSCNQPFTKGFPGSPYAICDHYDTNPYLADDESNRLEELKTLFERTHAAGLKIIIDFIPNHVGRDYGRSPLFPDRPRLGSDDDKTVHWKDTNDFFYYPGQALILPEGRQWDENPAMASGDEYSPTPSPNSWFDTIRINYCPWHTPTWDKMLDVLDYWCSLGADGFRCDMVEMVPAEFFRWAIAEIKSKYPGTVFVAEAYQKENYGTWHDAGFDLLYDKSILYDRVMDLMRGRMGADGLQHCFVSTNAREKLLSFLENHDEPRFPSPLFGDDISRESAPLALSLLADRSSFLIYFGQESGERAEEETRWRTSIFDFRITPSMKSFTSYVRFGTPMEEERVAFLNRFRELMALSHLEEFDGGESQDLSNLCPSPATQMLFLRRSASGAYLLFCNFSPVGTDDRIFISGESALSLGLHEGTIPLSAGPWDYSVTKYE